MTQDDGLFGFDVEPEPTMEAVEPEVVETLMVPAVPKMDIQPVALSLVPYQNLVKLMVQEAKEITVTDAESNTKASEVVSRHLRIFKELRDAKERFKKPFTDHAGQISNLFDTLADELLKEWTERGKKLTRGSIVLIKLQMANYELALRLERQKKEAELREEKRRLQEKLNAEARVQREEAERKAREAEEKLKTEKDEAARALLEQTVAEETAAAAAPTPQAPPPVLESRSATRTSEGVSFAKFKWTCKIMDPAQVPREYCEPSQKLLDAAMKGGLRSIEGCEITQEPIINVRT